ncbi:MAG: helix-turn-helix domain-containing protein [Planctomycetota bacterium]|nr:helix-turn-helix domain-containing protein [Planctomycetota bacterium]
MIATQERTAGTDAAQERDPRARLAALLRADMTARGIRSQAEYAATLRMSITAVNRMMRGVGRWPSRRVLERLAEATGRREEIEAIGAEARMTRGASAGRRMSAFEAAALLWDMREETARSLEACRRQLQQAEDSPPGASGEHEAAWRDRLAAYRRAADEYERRIEALDIAGRALTRRTV